MTWYRKWPVRFLLVWSTLTVVIGGWAYQREIGARWRAWRAGASSATSTGLASSRGLAEAQRRTSALAGGRADSIVLTAEHVASLLRESMGSEARTLLDSVTVTLGEDRVVFSARYAMSTVPREQLGVLAKVVHPWERITVGGTLRMTGARNAEWRVDEVRLRRFLLPTAVMKQFFAQTLEADADGRKQIPLPDAIGVLKVGANGIVLHPGTPG